MFAKPTKYFLLFALALVLPAPLRAEENAFDLYQEGQIPEAREAFAQSLTRAERSSDKGELWNALMSFAWFEDEIGDHRSAIEHSNRALNIASTLKDPARVGRSLSWLGWAYSSMGLYELAMQFYREAIIIGAPDGKVTIVHVWGLATQELGAIYFKTGNIKRGKELITETTNYAREHGISVGVAEGGSHLAEIALVEGDLPTAERLAKEAVSAGLECNCSQFNIARAKVTLAKVAFERAKFSPELRSSFLALTDEALNFAEHAGTIRPLAEAKLLLAKAIPPSEFTKRYDLVREAFELLESSESELRGTANAELGRVFLENDQRELAEFYLKQGYKVNKELFRKIDNAFIVADIADLEEVRGDLYESWKKREAAAKQAEKNGMLPLLLDEQEKLATELEQAGYLSLAQKWARRGLKTVDRLLETQRDQAARAQLETRRLSLMEQASRLKISMMSDGDTPDPAIP